jgi:hypothetical protein
MVLVRKPERNIPLVRPGYSLEDNIEMGWDAVGWILTWLRTWTSGRL